MRSAEAPAERRRAEAEVECENLRRTAEQRPRIEEKRLQDQYAVEGSKLEELTRTREETKERLRKEREHIDAELAESQKTLQFEAEKIKADLKKVRRDSETKAGQIRGDEASQEQKLRAEPEHALREGRQRLEAEFACSVTALHQAQQKLDQAEHAKNETDAETQRIASAMRVAEEQRRAKVEESRRAKQARIGQQTEQARAAIAKAETLKQQAEEKRRAAIRKLVTIRVAGGGAISDDGQAESLQAEIDRINENVSHALGEIDTAQRAKDDAEVVKFETEEKVAHQSSSEEELRLKLHEEAEDWLEQECARSAAELERAKQELAKKWASK